MRWQCPHAADGDDGTSPSCRGRGTARVTGIPLPLPRRTSVSRSGAGDECSRPGAHRLQHALEDRKRRQWLCGIDLALESLRLRDEFHYVRRSGSVITLPRGRGDARSRLARWRHDGQALRAHAEVLNSRGGQVSCRILPRVGDGPVDAHGVVADDDRIGPRACVGIAENQARRGGPKGAQGGRHLRQHITRREHARRVEVVGGCASVEGLVVDSGPEV
mmetsp:Transcript_26378/g.71258  ORF Transcript_26378/g.71258 Transcript_26378/m.71258 type:complete len:219 (-) Transcript_26378:1956-2612(-)